MAEVQLTEAPGRAKNVPKPPVFATFAEERRHRKERLAGAFRLFSRYGFDEGVAGHITARDPEYADHFWVNPFGVRVGQIRVLDLILVDQHGEVVEGNYPSTRRPSRFTRGQRAAGGGSGGARALDPRQGVVVVGRLLDPITQDACAFYEDHGLFDDFTGVVYETSEGDRIARRWARQGGDSSQSRNPDGGDDGDAAAWWFITMEHSCQAQLMAEAVEIQFTLPTSTPCRRTGRSAMNTAGGFSSSRCGRRSRGRAGFIGVGKPLPKAIRTSGARRAAPTRVSEAALQVPSKLNRRLVVSGCFGLARLVRLKASTWPVVEALVELESLGGAEIEREKGIVLQRVLRLTM